MTIRRVRTIILAIAAVGALCTLAAKPVGIIVDTDIGSSTDDLFVLLAIRAMERDGLCELKGVMVNRPCGEDDDSDCFRVFTEAFMHVYGWDGVPIGTVPKVPKEKVKRVFTPYWKLAFACDLWDKPPLPPPASRTGAVTNAVTLYRQLLSAAPDGSIDICSVGFFTPLVGFMDSRGDGISPLTGQELIARKVRTLRIMAGSFDGTLTHAEYNVLGDAPAAKRVFAEWPGKIVVTPYEVGSRVYLPQRKILKAMPVGSSNPIAMAYASWNPDGDLHKSQLMWDVCTVAGLWEGNLFEYSAPGFVTVETGEGPRYAYTTFRESAGGNTVVQRLANSSMGLAVRDKLQELACGRVTPDLAKECGQRICAVGGTNVVEGGIVVLRNMSTNGFDLSGCHLTCGLLEKAVSINYEFPPGTVLAPGASLKLVGSERWPESVVPDGAHNVILWTADWDLLHEAMIGDWFEMDQPDSFVVSRENKALMVDRADWSVTRSAPYFTMDRFFRIAK